MEWFERLYTKNFIHLCGFADPEQTQKEANFVVKALNLNQTSHLLDLCCGFGRISYEISKLCHCSITGLDLSEDYLSLAKKKYYSENINYIKGDMRNIRFTNQFDAVINLFTSFGFFEKDEENEKVLKEVNTALKPGGCFLLDYENKFYFVQNDVLSQKRYWQKKDEDTYYLIENKYDVFNEREVYEVNIIFKGKVVEKIGYDIRLYSLPELRAMLNRNGFEIRSIWGDYEGNPYTVQSKRLITLSRRVIPSGSSVLS